MATISQIWEQIEKRHIPVVSNHPKVILASQSPRRQSLLKHILPEFEIATAQVEEQDKHEGGPEALAIHNARIKANAIAQQSPNHWVIGSDTVVECDGTPLGKPIHRSDAIRMMRLLSGRKHNVHSGVAICNHSKTISTCFVETSEVVFFKLSEAQINRYVDTMNPEQYAGGYPIQYLLGSIVSGFDGSFTNVVGLPVEKLQKELIALGVLAA